MSTFIVNTVVASVALTALINLLPRLFPGSSAEDRIRDLLGDAAPGEHQTDDATVPKFRVWFPWKSMIIGSILITILINLIAFFG